MVELTKEFHENDDQNVDSCPEKHPLGCACWMAVNFYGGFLGPYQEVDLVSKMAGDLVKRGNLVEEGLCSFV